MDLALTYDYELWGNGSGDVFKHVIEPTSRLLKICNEHGAKVTIFFEVVEYWKMHEEWRNGNKMGYLENPCVAIEEQLIKAYLSGHDIQLHIHPQWIDAVYKNGGWQVGKYWCMNDVDQVEYAFPEGLFGVLKKGKKTVENIISKVSRKYHCNIFRAGGFNILPSDETIKKLSELGFIADSSVYPGGYDVNAKGVSKIDFRKINHFIPYWSVHNNNVLSQQYPLDPSRKMIEIPIFAYPIRRVFKYDVNRIRVNIDNWSRSLEKLGSRASSPQKKTFREKLDYLIGIEHITWDFCLFSKPKMRWFIKRATEIMKCSCYRYHPFVLIGHSKAFFYDDSLRLLLSNTGMRFLTLSDVVKNILENPSQTN